MEGAVEPQLHVDQVVDGWAQDALGSLGRLASVHRVGLALVEGGGRRLRFTASDRTDLVTRWCHVDAYDDVPLNRAVRTGTAVAGTLAELRPTFPAFVAGRAETPTRSVAAVPITAAGQVLGAFVLFYDQPTPSEESSLERLVARGAELGTSLRQAQRHRVRDLEDWADEVAPGARTARCELPLDPASVGEARSFLRRTLLGWGAAEDLVETAALCLSELVTNAVLHGSGGCAVRVSEESGVLTVAVRDAGQRPVSAPSPDTADPLAVHGRGLRLVDALASRWGSDLGANGVAVWFVLDA